MTSKGAAGASTPLALPRRSLVSVLVPAGVITLTGILILSAAWPTLRPVREVQVTQAVFDRTDRSVVETITQSVPEVPPVQAAGWLEAEPFITAVSALADGIIETVTVLEGDSVQTGEVVATLVPEDAELELRRAKALEAAAKSRLALAHAEYDAAQSDWDQPVELERRVATSLARMAKAEGERNRLPSLIDSAQATLVRYEEELRRVQQAFAEAAATELEVVIARQRAVALRADLAALDAQRGVLDAEINAARAEEYAASQAFALRINDRLRLDASKAGMGLARAELEHASGVRAEAELRLERMVIRSSVAGYVQRRMKSPGDKAFVMMDDPASAQIVHVYDPSRLQVRVDVPLADAANVSVGQVCEVTVEILPDTQFVGRVLRVTHEADLQKNTLQVKVAVENPSPLLKPEMLTRVRFLGSDQGPADAGLSIERASRVKIPIAVIDDSSGFDRVWIVSDRLASRGVAEAVGIEIVDKAGKWASVEGLIQPGALLITDPAGLKAGQSVSIQSDSEPSPEASS